MQNVRQTLLYINLYKCSQPRRAFVKRRLFNKTKLNCCRKNCKDGMGLRDVTSRRTATLRGPRAGWHGTVCALPGLSYCPASPVSAATRPRRLTPRLSVDPPRRR